MILGKKRLVIILISVMAAAVIGIFAYVGIMNAVNEGRDVKYRDEAAPIILEMSELEKQRYGMINEYMGEAPCGANTSIVFLDMNARLYEQVYPLVAEREHLSAILALRPEQMPGGEGKITAEQLHELIGAGWSIAIFWEGVPVSEGVDTAALSDYLSRMKDELLSLGLELPDTVIFDRATYSVEYDSVLSDYGVKFASHFGDGAFPLIDKQTEGEIMRPGVVGWNTNGYGNQFLISVEKEKGIAAFAIEFESGGDLGSYLDLDRTDYMDAFGRMLDAIEENAANGDVSCTSFAEAYFNRVGYVDAWTRMMDVIGDDLAAIADRISVLEDEVLEIMKKYERKERDA